MSLDRPDNGGSTESVLFEPFEETVETTIEDGDPSAHAILSHSEFISCLVIKVTFDGTEYICDGVVEPVGASYGAAENDWTSYPFVLVSVPNGSNSFYTETAGTHSIKVEPYVDLELMNILENGKSVNAALMRLVKVYGGTPELSDSNANLIDKLAKLIGSDSSGSGTL